MSGLKRKRFDFYNNILSDKIRNEQVDRDYNWLLTLLLSTTPITHKQNLPTNNRSYDFDSDENLTRYEDEQQDDADPQYTLFLQNLEPNGRSYKLKISKHDEPVRFLHYEESENSLGYDDDDDANQFPQDMQIVQRDEPNEIGNEHLSVIGPYFGPWDPCYLEYMKHYNPSTGKFSYKGKEVQYEKSLVLSEKQQLPVEKKQVSAKKRKLLSEKQQLPVEKKQVSAKKRKLVSEKQQGPVEKQPLLSEKQPLLAEKQQVPAKKQLPLPEKQSQLAETHLSLKEKLMHILRKPYSKREYKDLKKYAEKQKPICRLLPLRDRAISSALKGKSKSVLDASPGCFRRRFESAKKEQSKSKALNLLRMLRFWLEHLPNEDIFEPWLDKDILAVLPLPRTT